MSKLNDLINEQNSQKADLINKIREHQENISQSQAQLEGLRNALNQCVGKIEAYESLLGEQNGENVST